jgi:hypothetical protein
MAMQLARERFSDTHVHLVPNSVDTTQFHAPPSGKQTVPTVGMLYSTLPLKGLDIALAAPQQVRQKIVNLKVMLFAAERVSPKLSLPEWCEFHYRPPQEYLF